MLLLLMAIQAAEPQDVNINVNSCRICNAVKLIRGDPKARNAKKVGKLLAAGDCAGAEKYALEAGDLDLADRVKARCAPSAAPPATAQPQGQ